MYNNPLKQHSPDTYFLDNFVCYNISTTIFFRLVTRSPQLEFTLPQDVTDPPLVRDLKDTETAVLVAEMQEILDKVMHKMQREAHHRPINIQGVFNYEDDYHNYYEDQIEEEEEEGEEEEEKEQMTFSMLMNMKKTNKPKSIEKYKQSITRNKIKLEKETTSRVKFATDKKLTVDPVIGQMMRNIDLYQKFSHGKLLGKTEQHFRGENFSPILFQTVG